MTRRSTRPSGRYQLADHEIRVVLTTRDRAVEKTMSVGGRSADERDLRASLDSMVLVLGYRAADRDEVTGPLTPHEVEVLTSGGFKADPPVGMSAIERGRLEYTHLLATSHSVAAAARLLKVNTSRVRQRLIARELFGIKDGRAWRLPRFQFLRGRLVPGIDRVLPHVPVGLHPVAVMRWFDTPNPDLTVGDDEEPTTPRDWLTSGRDPAAAAALAGEGDA